MTINLPENLERSILAEVHNGHFASIDDAITEAVRLLLRRKEANRSHAGLDAADAVSAQPGKPAWERTLERTAGIPDEEFDKLPSDLAEQHDHYLYGTPKRRAE